MRFPSRRFEIINAAAGGQNATRVRAIVEQLVHYDPDAVLVMSGNNEGYVAATTFNEPLYQWVVYRALKKTLLREPELSERSYFSPQDPDTLKIERNFQNQITRMVELCRKSNVRPIVATLPINLRYDNTGVDTNGVPLPVPTDDPFLIAGDRLRVAGDCENALADYSQSRHTAAAAFRMARCLEELERFDEARSFYKVYVQNNPLNRIRPSFNEFIRTFAAARNITLIDLERALERRSEHGLPSLNLFHDYCHMTWRGYRMVAEEIVDVLIEQRIVTGRFREPLPRPTTEEIIRRQGWDVLLQLGDRYPFVASEKTADGSTLMAPLHD
ncbi:MAG: SGNH/GDSL hydrolase family protein [Deltaproteobacteria bacterium]|nr:SGNH/GDSL hydrolase family protein [Deltaproteobacteria bacterium]